jgi:hypothetical protein
MHLHRADVTGAASPPAMRSASRGERLAHSTESSFDDVGDPRRSRDANAAISAPAHVSFAPSSGSTAPGRGRPDHASFRWNAGAQGSSGGARRRVPHWDHRCEPRTHAEIVHPRRFFRFQTRARDCRSPGRCLPIFCRRRKSASARPSRQGVIHLLETIFPRTADARISSSQPAGLT